MSGVYIFENDSYFNRVVALNSGDTISVGRSCVIDDFPRLGQSYTFWKDGFIRPTILHTDTQPTKEIILIKINKSNKRWWQFWIKRVPVSFEFKIQ